MKEDANVSEKQQENEASKKAAGVAAKGAIDYFTGGKGGQVYDAAKKVPVVGKKLDKAEEKLGAAANNATGGKFGKVAKKADDVGALDAADTALSMGKGGGASKASAGSKNMAKGPSSAANKNNGSKVNNNAGVRKSPNSQNNNIGKNSLNGNNNIAQPSRSPLDQEKEKNSNKLQEQLQKNALRAAANMLMPGVGGKVVDAVEKGKQKKKSTSSENELDDGNDNNSFFIKGKGKFKKVMMWLAPLIPFAFIFVAMFLVIISLNRFADLIGVGSGNVDPDIVAAAGGDKQLEKLYKRILKVQEDFADDGKVFSADKVAAVYHILTERSHFVFPSTMTKKTIKKLANYMFDKNCPVVGKCTYTYSEQTFRDNLTNKFFPKYLKPSECSKATDEVFEYLKQYGSIFGNSTSNSTGITGGSCSMSGNVQLADIGPGDYAKCIEVLGPIANEAYSITGIFASVTLAQAILESGCGREVPNGDSNNLFGIKCTNARFSLSTWDGTCTPPVSTTEYENGVAVIKNEPFRKYKSINEAVLDHAALLASGRAYTPLGVAQKSDPFSQLEAIAHAGYAKDNGTYAPKLTRIINQYNLQQWDTKSFTSCSEGGGESSNWLQTDSKWSSVKLGSSSETVGSAGCLSTSIAMLVSKFNAATNITGEFNPGSFVQALSSVGAYNSGGSLYWQKVTDIVPSFSYAGQTSLAGKSKDSKLSTIQEYVNGGYAVVAEVKGSTGQHWVAVNSVNGSTINMMDPASNDTDMWGRYNWENTSRIGYFKVG